MSVKQATGNVRGELVAPAEIKFSRQPLKGEPELKLMEDVVQRMSARISSSDRQLMLPVRHSSMMGNQAEILDARAYLASLVFEEVDAYEQDPLNRYSWQAGRQSPYFALYVFGVFRFGLNIKDLSPLSVRLHKEGDVSNNTFRSLYRKGVEAHRHAPVATPLAHLGLDSRYWNWR